jgi:carboxypeptidase C (cathepsin A)
VHAAGRTLKSLRRLWVLLGLVPLLPGLASTQDAPAVETKQSVSAAPSRPTAVRQLPADSVTRHILELPDRTLRFTATTGAILLTANDGHLLAEVGYISYTLDGAEALHRPVAFAFNGGPGVASCWLHLGAFGPWRLPFEGAAISPSAPPVTTANAETWLDFADLVFIDPVGTGFSRLAGASGEGGSTQPGSSAQRGAPSSPVPGNRETGGPRYFYSVNGDVESIAEVIYQWLRKHNRLTSPKMLVGESYGGMRVPKIAHRLQTSQGIGVNAIVMISPVLDFGFLSHSRHQPIAHVILLPSLAAAAKEAKGEVPSREAMRDVENYAKGDYLSDLMQGPRNAPAVDRIVKRVAALTSLSEATVRRYGGRLDSSTYQREANRPEAQIASAYDASVKGFDPDPSAPFSRFTDPLLTALRGPVSSTMLDLYANRLNWRVEATYHVINDELSRVWTWGNSLNAPESVTDLKSALALDANLIALVAHGFTDLVTPYFGSELLLDQIPAYGNAERLKLAVYPGGHMFYSRDGSRSAFRDEVRSLLAAALTEPAAKKKGSRSTPE